MVFSVLITESIRTTTENYDNYYSFFVGRLILDFTLGQVQLAIQYLPA